MLCCIVRKLYSFDGFALNIKKTSKGNILLLLQSILAEISAAVGGLLIMEQLQEELI